MTKEQRSEYNRRYRLSRLEELRQRDRERYNADIEGARANVRDKARKRRERDPDAVNRYKRELAARKRADTEAHREALNAANAKRRADRLADPDGTRAKDRDKYRRQQKRNPHMRRAQAQRRIARSKKAPGRGISANDRRSLEAANVGVCPYCSLPASRWDIDHIEPLSGGGAHDVDNAVAACVSCNRSKNDRPLIVWLAKL